MAGFDPSELPAATLSTLLEAGSWVLVEDDKGALKRTTSGILVDATPAEVKKLLEDYDGYKSWMPQLTKSDVVSAKGGASDVAFTLSFRFSVVSKSLDYTLRYKTKGDNRIEWDRVAGDFETSHGAWTWVPIDGASRRRATSGSERGGPPSERIDRGKRTAVFYSHFVDLSGLGAMVKMALKASPQMEVAIATSTAILIAKALKAKVEA